MTTHNRTEGQSGGDQSEPGGFVFGFVQQPYFDHFRTARGVELGSREILRHLKEAQAAALPHRPRFDKLRKRRKPA